MAIISFEDLVPGDDFLARVPNGFRNLNWNKFLAVEAAEIFPSDEFFRDAIHSGEAFAINGFGEKLSGFQSADRDNDFDLNSGYFTAAYANDLQVKVIGFDNGKKVAMKSFDLDNAD